MGFAKRRNQESKAMHRLFTATAIIISAALVSLSADAGGPHVRVFSGSESAAAAEGHKDWINLLSVHSII
ncbi:MAG: hypothetical protein ACOC91_03010, partial [bacterium]